VDRVDSWLNGQVGWHRVALTWLVLCPSAVAGGSLLRAFRSLGRPGCEQLGGARFAQECEPRLGAGFLAVAAISVLAAGPLAGLLAVYQRWWAGRNPGKPFFSWRRIGSIWCLMTALLLNNLFDRPPHNQALELSGWILIAASAAFLLLEMRHRRLTRG